MEKYQNLEDIWLNHFKPDNLFEKYIVVLLDIMLIKLLFSILLKCSNTLRICTENIIDIDRISIIFSCRVDILLVFRLIKNDFLDLSSLLNDYRLQV